MSAAMRSGTPEAQLLGELAHGVLLAAEEDESAYA
jgi:hypothetical protein